jgi:hypothetical protein
MPNDAANGGVSVRELAAPPTPARPRRDAANFSRGFSRRPPRRSEFRSRPGNSGPVAAVSKTVVGRLVHRGFESHPLRCRPGKCLHRAEFRRPDVDPPGASGGVSDGQLNRHFVAMPLPWALPRTVGCRLQDRTTAKRRNVSQRTLASLDEATARFPRGETHGSRPREACADGFSTRSQGTRRQQSHTRRLMAGLHRPARPGSALRGLRLRLGCAGRSTAH